VLGAYFVLYPNSRIRTLVGWFPIDIPHVGGFIFGVVVAGVLSRTRRITA
jgi:membrane associated rhomboid family serine protease